MEKKEEKEVVEEKTEKNEENEVKQEKKKNSVGVVLCFVIIAFLVLAIIGVLLSKIDHNNETNNASEDKTDYKSEYRMSGNSLEDFDLYFLQAENKEENRVYSPLSIKYALAMLAEGANGDSKEQIVNVIGDYKAKSYPNSEHMSFANAMFIRNSLKENVKDSYINTLKEKFSADVKYEDFNSADPMNQWVSEKTFDLIHDLLDDDAVNDADFFLINALGIDMNWKYLIHCAMGSKDRVPCYKEKYGAYTVSYPHEKLKGDENEFRVNSNPYIGEGNFPPLDFNGHDNTKSAEIFADFNNYDIIKELGEDNIRKIVGDAYREWLVTDESVLKGYYIPERDVDKYLDQFVEELKTNYGKEDQSTDFMLYDDKKVKAFAKDLQEYDGTTLQYVGIMPKEEKLTDYIQNIKAKDINSIIQNLKEMKKENFKDGIVTLVRGQIPMFQYEYKLDLINDLKELGIQDVFDKDKADLKNMIESNSVNYYIFDARHKANIEFSNEGIKAAAATSVGGAGATGGGFNYLFEVPYEKIDLTFDKPYMYVIRDKATGEVWFAGAVYEGKEREVPKDRRW